MAEQAVKWEVKNGIGIITLNRPDKRNALNGDVLEGIRKSFSDLNVNREARVILLQGAGPSFSAGIDFNYESTVMHDDGRPEGVNIRDGIDVIQTILNRIERIEKAVVVKIQGFCGGLGLELALTADFRIACESATLGVPEIILGTIPDCGGTTRLTRTLGPARAKELIMTGDMIPAKRAYEIGLIHQICPDDRLEETTQAFLTKLSQKSPLALGLAKRAVDWGVGMDKMRHMDIEGSSKAF